MPHKEVIFTDKAPAPIGPYSQATRFGELFLVSGQIPVDPSSGKIVEGGIVEQTIRVMENIGAILATQAVGFQHVLETTIFLADMADFKAVNEVYGKYFTGEFPARATVQVAKLPLDVRVEIKVMAGIPSAPPTTPTV